MIEYYTCQYYSLMSDRQCDSLEEIPSPARRALSYMTYEEIIRPFVLEDLEEGKLSSRGLARKYSTTLSRIRQIGRKYGYYKRYEPCET